MHKKVMDMSKKLKNLHVTKVDFVDEGANPRADIKLFKRKGPGTADAGDPPGSIMGKIAGGLSGVFKRPKGPVEKGEASSFKEALGEEGREKVLDEIWTVCYALQRSLGSIISDRELEVAETLEKLNESAGEFCGALEQYIPVWAAGAPADIKKRVDAPDETELPMLEAIHADTGELIEKANNKKGELDDMIKIDKSKMTPEERAAYDELIKKYAVETGGESGPGPEPESVGKKGSPPEEDDIEDGEEKGKGGKAPAKKSVHPEDTPDGGENDVYKGIHPAVRAEIESLKKFKEEAELKELMGIAKKYEIIGKKPEELAPTLKALKEAGGTAYNDMIGILDSMADAIDSSGVFGEIGKSREGDPEPTRDEAVAKARAKAAEIMKGNPGLTEAQALDQAFLSEPELMEAFDR